MKGTQILQCLKQNEVHSPDEVRALSINITKIGAGYSRKVYSIDGTPWVIKFGHSESEVDSIIALRKVPSVRQFLPGLIWFNETKDVVVMLRYQTPDGNGNINWVQAAEICRHIWEYVKRFDTGWHWADLHYQNVGTDSKGRFKVIDCGNFREMAKEIPF